MIHDLLLRWVVTGLFVLSAAITGLVIATQRRPWTMVGGHGLHFVMSVAMAAMAWPWGTRLPTTGPAVFFLLATVWFVTVAVVAAPTTAQRGLHGYDGLMMLATAWMYAMGASMPGMDMAAMNMPASSGSPIWFSAVNWFGTVSFAVAAVFWTYRYVKELPHQPTRCRSLGNLGQAMMAAGMAILFLATLFRI